MSDTPAARRPSLEKRQALARALLGNGRAAPASPTAPIRPREEAGPVPLSFSQQRLWFLDHWNPGSSYYNVPIALRLRGTLDAAALGASLDAVVERHEVLRSTFPMVDGEPRQVIVPALAAGLPLVDLSHLPAAEREREVERLALEEATRPFDLATGPLLRRSLLRLGADEHVL